ncbi:MAG: nicotinate phosphoribosyltransferase [Nanoarchaeota archaeon]|nr:nicotinate phosphoribosyltransferase [Nanoarchaeota archaeon]
MKNKMQAFADKYFLRSDEILRKEGLNPWVNMQVFVRKGPGEIAGIDEAIDIITQNSNIAEVGGRIYAKSEGDIYTPTETVMNIVAPIQSIMPLETVYLGPIASETTRRNDHKEIDLEAITRNVEQVVALAGGRPVFYFGARHWHYNMDAEITAAAFAGGCASASTDNGASTAGQKGMGTIPHALENVYAFYHGVENAVAESTAAFDRHMDPNIPRVALVDYNNREIDDSVQTSEKLRSQGSRLSAVRIDTCGENYAQGAREFVRDSEFAQTADQAFGGYFAPSGVSIAGAIILRQWLDAIPGPRIGLVLSSGFSSPAKVQAFNDAEAHYGMKIYDSIGAGFLDGIRTSTADIIAVGNSADQVDYFVAPIAEHNIIHKVGRPPKYNTTLERRV